MAEIEEMRTENRSIDEMRIENHVQLIKVYIGSGDDFIMVSGNDFSIISRFMAAGDELEAMVGEMEKEEAESRETDHKKEIEDRRNFSEKAAEIMDGVFGEGITKKFFGDVYAEIPNFEPDIECFIDFWNSLIPVIERLSEHKVKLQKLASQKRMSKYKPQDYKKKARR